jgi:flagellar protein FliO/FliZ
MKIHLNLFFLSFFILPFSALAADAVVVSPSGGVLKMVLGLVVVLAVMALITWGLKRVMPSVGGNKQSAISVVGGVSVGSRERVVVLEVAGRWIVVGVASGQVNGLANLDAGSSQFAENVPNAHLSTSSLLNPNLDSFTQSFAPSFAQWLKKSTAKFTETKNSEKPDEK